ncbi:MAG: hypothetical protein P8176_15145 [Gammaproteobacteria bacterium]
MKLFVTPLPSQPAALPQDLFEELIQLGIPAEPAIAVPVTPQASKGDPVTLASVAMIALGAGGALTAAVSKGGALTQLAKVLEKYVNRQVRLELETSAGKKVKLSGSAGEIRAVLEQLDG